MGVAHVDGQGRVRVPVVEVHQGVETVALGGLHTVQTLGTFFDGVARHTEEARRWVESFDDKGFRNVIRERDAPWQDYGEAPRG